MAQRPVFRAVSEFPFVRETAIEFAWNSGFSIAQSRRNIRALHEAYHRSDPNARMLEISSKTEQLPEGKELSAFFLPIRSPEADREVTVECAFQSAKVFENGGPYTDLLDKTSREAKRDPRLTASGAVIAFRFGGRDYPTLPRTAFYHYLYCTALLQSPQLSEQLLSYDAFTDIAFNPERSLNCQARSAALYVGLSRAGKLDCLNDFETFLDTVFPSRVRQEPKPAPSPKPEIVPDTPVISVGSIIVHPVWGRGTVLAAGDKLRISFASGEKLLGTAWVLKQCTVVPK